MKVTTRKFFIDELRQIPLSFGLHLGPESLPLGLAPDISWGTPGVFIAYGGSGELRYHDITLNRRALCLWATEP